MSALPPKVSVIVTTYNRAGLLPRAVESVMAQTYGDFEVLVVDDCSTDDTPTVIAGFADPRIRAFRHDANRGQSAARNLGITEAQGKYLAFLDDDDEFVPTRLEEQVALLEASPPDTALVYGWMERCDDATGERAGGVGSRFNGDVFEFALTGRNIATTLTILVRTAVAREVGGFREDLAIGEDPFFIACTAQRYKVACLPQVVSVYHVNHAYSRLTAEGDLYRTGVDKHLRAHIERFLPELEKRPRLFADVLRRSAVHSMECGAVRRSVGTSLKALRLRPLAAANIGPALRLAKVFIFYVTPISRFRRRAQAVQRALGLRRERTVAAMIDGAKR